MYFTLFLLLGLLLEVELMILRRILVNLSAILGERIGRISEIKADLSLFNAQTQ